jgi:hypothetical protein
MTDEKWQRLIQVAKETFDDVSLRTEDLLVETGEETVKQGTQEILEFSNDMGIFKVIRETKPAVLEKKMHYSHRQGDSASTEYVFSDTEVTHKVRIFGLGDDDEWRELESTNLNVFTE